MKNRRIEIERIDIVSSKPFDAVVAELEAAIGHPDVARLQEATEGPGSFYSTPAKPSNSFTARLVAEELRRRFHEAKQMIGERGQLGGGRADPLGERRALDMHAVARKDLRLPVEWKASRAEGFHLRALPEPYVRLSTHTAPSIRPF